MGNGQSSRRTIVGHPFSGAAPFLIAAAVVFAARDAPAQTRPDYVSLVRMYAARQADDALPIILGQTADTVGRAVRRTIEAKLLSPRELLFAALMHTDAALMVVDVNPFRAEFHTDAARQLMHAGGDGAVTRRWYAFAVSIFVSARQLRQANAYIREGLRHFPGDAMLHFVQGTTRETSVHVRLARDFRRDLPDDPRLRKRIEDDLQPAADAYRRALAIDPHLAVAHLRLGWLRMYVGDSRRAKPELEAALAHADTDTIRYLARLFLGGVAESENRLDDAKREYEAAIAAGAGHQTGYVALSRVEEALGHTARARELALSVARTRKSDEDPWWDYKASFDRDTLNWLRAESLRR